MADIIQRLLTQNDCYRAGRTIKPKGIMVHSLGVAQPDPEVFIRSWDRPGVEVAVHAIVGAESVTQLLPWHWRGWHAGTGTSGQSANNTHISFECCEPAGHSYQGGTMIGYDAPANDGYFRAVYRNAVELAAYLCKLYKLDPLADGVLICHSEGYRRGVASNHADVMHWWPKHGKNMDTFRAEVVAKLGGSEPGTPVEPVRGGRRRERRGRNDCRGSKERAQGESRAERHNDYLSVQLPLGRRSVAQAGGGSGGQGMREKLAKLIDVKSIVTLGLSVCMAMLLFGGFQPPQEALALFCTSYGAIITYFFTRKEG